MKTQFPSQRKSISSPFTRCFVSPLLCVIGLEILRLLSKCSAFGLQRCDRRPSMAEDGLLCDTGYSQKMSRKRNILLSGGCVHKCGLGTPYGVTTA